MTETYPPMIMTNLNTFSYLFYDFYAGSSSQLDNVKRVKRRKTKGGFIK